MNEPWKHIGDMLEKLEEVVAASRKAERGLTWNSASEVLGPTRHVRSQVEPLIEYLERRLGEYDGEQDNAE